MAAVLAHSHDRVTAYLERVGYSLHLVPSWHWAGTRVHSRARVHLAAGEMGAVRGALERMVLLHLVWPRTLVGLLLPTALPRIDRTGAALAAFQVPGELVDAPRPKFVLAHSLLVHEPVLVDDRCRPLPEPVEDGAATPRGRAAYLAAIRCTNARLLDVVTRVLRESKSPPVILLQSDHGPSRAGTPWFGDSAAAITPEQAVERLAVFGAYLLPGAETLLPDTVSAINVMRGVLSHYLGAETPPLPERSMHATIEFPYRHVEIAPTAFAESPAHDALEPGDTPANP